MSFGYQVLGFGAGAAGAAPYNVEYLVIAGGAQGGRAQYHSGGGGAGGYRTAGCYELTSGTPYTITIGAGGTGPYPNPSCSPFHPVPAASGQNFGSNGNTSVFAGITSQGGGAGTGQGPTTPGMPGGSGGGGGHNLPGGCGSMDNFSNPAPSQGYAGGTASHSGPAHGAAGGGGSGAVGQNGTGPQGGLGGAGACSAILCSGSCVTRASGGAGTGLTTGDRPAVPGGGGASTPGATCAARNGTANTGGGSGGSRGVSGIGANNSVGGSGVVFVRIPTASYTGTTTGSPTETTEGANTILTFNDDGTYTA